MILSIYTFLFTENGKYYLFNSESLYFSEISEDLYEILYNHSWDELPEELFSELKEKGIIVNREEKYTFYYDSLTRFLTDAYGSKHMSLIIAPTTGCNFECPYCFEPKKNPRSVTKETIDKIIDYVNNQKEIETVSLTWYGGEPLLMAAEIETIHKRLKSETEKKIQYQELISNAYLIDDHVIAIFKEIGLDRIQISIDGIKENHDKTRFLKGTGTPTFDRIMANIEKLAESMPELDISLRVNINRNNRDDFVKIYDMFSNEERHRKIYPYPGLIREDATGGNKLCYSSINPSELVGLYIYFRQRGVNLDFFPRRRSKGCMLQRSSAFIIGPEGELYKCWNDVSSHDKVIGSIADNRRHNYPRLMRYMHECSPFDDECKECFVFPICDGGCGMLRYRNRFEGSDFFYCSAFRDKENLKRALLSSTEENPNKEKKQLRL